MKIAVTATGPELDARVDPRFGRCPFFVIVETDNLGFEGIENPNVTQGSGAGIQSAQLMAEKGVQHVLTGNCGPNAHQTLSAAGIGVIVGCSGTVREAVEQYKARRLTAVSEPNVASHFGMGQGAANQSNAAGQGFAPAMGGGGRGMGMGRGMGGGGRGMGMGGGMGRGRGMAAAAGFSGGQGPQADPGQDELNALKQQAEMMARQMQQIHQRIQQIEQEKSGR